MFSRSIALKSSSMVSAANVAPLFASVANSGHGFVVDPKSPSLFRAELKKGEPTWAVAAVLMVGAGFWVAGFVNRSSDEPSNERGINYYMAKFAINSHCS